MTAPTPLVVIFLVSMLVTALTPWGRNLGGGKLLGDMRLKLFGRELFLALISTILLSLLGGTGAIFVRSRDWSWPASGSMVFGTPRASPLPEPSLPLEYASLVNTRLT